MKFLNMLLSDSMLPILFSEASDEDIGILVRVVIRYISGMPYDFKGRNDLKAVFIMSLKPVLDEWSVDKNGLVHKRRNIGRLRHNNKTVSDTESLFDEKYSEFDVNLHQQTDRYNISSKLEKTDENDKNDELISAKSTSQVVKIHQQTDGYNNSTKNEFWLKNKESTEIVGNSEVTSNNQPVSVNNSKEIVTDSENQENVGKNDNNLRQQSDRLNISSKLEKTGKNDKNEKFVSDNSDVKDTEASKTDRYNSSSKNDVWLKQNLGDFEKNGSRGDVDLKESDVPSVSTDNLQRSNIYNNISKEESKSLGVVNKHTTEQLQDSPLQSADSYNRVLSAEKTNLYNSNDELSDSTALNPLQSDKTNRNDIVLPEDNSNSQEKSKILEETLANRWVTSMSSRDLAEELWGKLSEAWNNLDSLRKARGLTENRRVKINALLKKYSADEILEGVALVGQSDFLLGKKNMVVKDGKNIRGWAATVDWFFDHFDEIFEGKYTDTEQEKNGYHDLMKQWVDSGVVCKGA